MWDADKGDFKPEASQHFRDMAARDAAEASRRLTLPQKPEDYKLALPKDFKAPEGMEFVLDEKDPMTPHARAFAQKHGLSQDAFTELVGLRASMDVQMKQQLKDFEAGEVTKLGVNGPARKTAIDTWLKAQLGEDVAKHISATMRTSVQAEAFEKLMANFRTQGAGGPSSAHRDGPEPAGTIPNYDTLSFEQRRFAQDQQRRAAAR